MQDNSREQPEGSVPPSHPSPVFNALSVFKKDKVVPIALGVAALVVIGVVLYHVV